MDEAALVCDYIELRAAGDRSATRSCERFAKQAPHRASIRIVHLARIGVANQTTMLARESLAIAHAVGEAMERALRRRAPRRALPLVRHDLQRHAGAAGRRARLLEEPLDVMVVVGGYNSSNTISLAALCAEQVPTYHIEDAICLDPETGTCATAPSDRMAEVAVHRLDARRAARCASASRRARAHRTTRSARRWRGSSPRAGSGKIRSEGKAAPGSRLSANGNCEPRMSRMSADCSRRWSNRRAPALNGNWSETARGIGITTVLEHGARAPAGASPIS